VRVRIRVRVRVSVRRRTTTTTQYALLPYHSSGQRQQPNANAAAATTLLVEQGVGGVGGQHDPTRDVRIRLFERAGSGSSLHWKEFWHMMSKDHRQIDLIWNDTTRTELQGREREREREKERKKERKRERERERARERASVVMGVVLMTCVLYTHFTLSAPLRDNDERVLIPKKAFLSPLDNTCILLDINATILYPIRGAAACAGVARPRTARLGGG
jgi:hypothetical protein